MQKNQPRFLLLGIILVASVIFAHFAYAKESVGVSINFGTQSTKIRSVTLDMNGGIAPTKMFISNTANFDTGVWEPYVSSKLWTLPLGSGSKSVYVKFQDKNGLISIPYSDSIDIVSPGVIQGTILINKGGETTNSRTVQIDLTYSDGVEAFAVTNDSFVEEDMFLPARPFLTWVVPSGTGEKTVYVHLRDVTGGVKVISDTIKYVESERYISEGALLRSQKSSVYYMGADGKLHPFLNPIIFHSWFNTVNRIEVVSEAKLREFQVDQPVCIRPGTWLVKFKGIPRIYAVEPGCQIRPLRSEAEAVILYGPGWLQRVVELDMLQSNFYTVRSLSAADSKSNVIDKDNDGVPLLIERDYGTSDGVEDQDGDAVSDYEEIYYWFSDPTKKDTDGDGELDGKEIMRGTSPTGVGKIINIPSGTYRLPRGASDGDSLFNIQSTYSLQQEQGASYDSNKPSTSRFNRIMSL